MSGPVLVAVAHGSAHPDARPAVAALARQIGRLAPVIDVRIAFAAHAEPSLAAALADAGSGAVVVPLLLSTGYHLTTDLTTDLTGGLSAGIGPARPLGPDPLLTIALAARLREAGVPAGTPVVLAAAGSSDPRAEAEVGDQAAMLAEQLGTEVTAAFAAAGQPAVPEAVARVRARTGGPVAVASYLLAPGQFHRRLAASGADWVSAPLGDHPAVAALVIDRYRTQRAAA